MDKTENGERRHRRRESEGGFKDLGRGELGREG